jgi:hypothetical protein
VVVASAGQGLSADASIRRSLGAEQESITGSLDSFAKKKKKHNKPGNKEIYS